jgi:hypothetical protein
MESRRSFCFHPGPNYSLQVRAYNPHSSAKIKARAELHEPIFRVSMVLQKSAAGWRVIHFHESAISAQAVE